MSTQNDFCHMELATDDLGKSRGFYKALFAWDFEEMDMGPAGTYVMVKPGTGPTGGMYGRNPAEAASGWRPYVKVDNLAGSLEKAKGLGAEVLVPPTDLPEGAGAYSVLKDPTGGVIGIFQQ